MITSKSDLQYYLQKDSENYISQNQGFLQRLKYNLLCSPISDQEYIWKYIWTLRHLEYHINHHKSFYNQIMKIYFGQKLRHLSYKTGYQIPPNVIDEGLTIWHFGSIIINGSSHIGRNVVLNPGIIIGHKKSGESAPIIGNNVFIGGGTKIIGSLYIGNDVIIGVNSTIVKDIPDNVVIAGNPARIISDNKDQKL